MAVASPFVLDATPELITSNVHPMLSDINVGTGPDVSIAELARTVAEITGFRGEIAFDTSKPDGTPRKLLDISRLSAMDWRARTDLRCGITGTYDWFCRNLALRRA
jgi:nucleoside-diphosphate-sugar epimerase